MPQGGSPLVVMSRCVAPLVAHLDGPMFAEDCQVSFGTLFRPRLDYMSSQLWYPHDALGD